MKMANMKVWFDEEGDFLEVAFAERAGHFQEIGPDVYERVDEQGDVVGFAIFNFSKRERQAIEVPLEVVSVPGA